MFTTRALLLQELLTGDGYGLDLIERMSKRTQGEVLLLQGSVYPQLRDLEKEGIVESYASDPTVERGGRPRVYYRLTKEGRKVANKERATIMALVAALAHQPE